MLHWKDKASQTIQNGVNVTLRKTTFWNTTRGLWDTKKYWFLADNGCLFPAHVLDCFPVCLSTYQSRKMETNAKSTKRTSSNVDNNIGETCDTGSTANIQLFSEEGGTHFVLKEIMNVTLPSALRKLVFIADDAMQKRCGVFCIRRQVAAYQRVIETGLEEDGTCCINGYNKIHNRLLRAGTSSKSVEENSLRSRQLEQMHGRENKPTGHGDIR